MIKTTLKIDGMMCGMCESHVNDAIRKAFPAVKKVTSSHGKGETVVISENPLDEAQVKAAIAATYTGTLPDSSIATEKPVITALLSDRVTSPDKISVPKRSVSTAVTTLAAITFTPPMPLNSTDGTRHAARSTRQSELYENFFGKRLSIVEKITCPS